MDNVLVDFPSGIARISNDKQIEYEGRLDEVPGIFALGEHNFAQDTRLSIRGNGSTLLGSVVPPPLFFLYSHHQ